MSEILRIEGLRKSLPPSRTLSADVFAVNQGDCALLVGDNGSGKTTLLRIFAGLAAADAAAKWRLYGRERIQSRERTAGAVLLHQTPFMFAASARANVAVAARDRARIEEALQWAELSRVASSPARDLSGGERARISLARARAAADNIKLCLMDEPAAHLDADGLALAADLVRSLRARGAAVVIAAPARTKALPFNRIWRLRNDGRLSECDS